MFNLEADVVHQIEVSDGHRAVVCIATDALAGLDGDAVHVGKWAVKVGP